MTNIQKCTNDGGTTDYYQILPEWKQAQDIIEARGMNFSQGNILKAAFCFNTPRHRGTDYARELRKIIWFAQRELDSLETNQKVLLDAMAEISNEGIKIPEICKSQNTSKEENSEDLGDLKNVIIEDFGVNRISAKDFEKAK